MEIRVLQYFLTIVREENISKAAETLHLTQPTLSRQMKDLEDKVGKQLFTRGNRKITLTKEGMLLKKRAEEIISLVEKTRNEIKSDKNELLGDVYIGCAETNGMRLIAKTINKIQKIHPQIKFHIYSAKADDVCERLNKGLLDFGILIDPANLSEYDFIKLPSKDTWGVYMKKDDPLSFKSVITPLDLIKLPLICSNQSMVKNEMAGWLSGNERKLNIVATYNLIYNASLLAKENCGYVLGLQGLINTDNNSDLCFKPLEPKLEVGISLVWKKYQLFSDVCEYFLETLQRGCNEID